MTDRFPELAAARDFLPDGTVIDGEVLAWSGNRPLPFAALQKRIGRKTVPKKLLAEAPVILRAYDLLEWEGADIRDRPFADRRTILEALVRGLPASAPIRLSDRLAFATWDDLAAIRARSRDEGAEGLMLKRLASPTSRAARRATGGNGRSTRSPSTR
jgi:DNA ligase 1